MLKKIFYCFYKKITQKELEEINHKRMIILPEYGKLQNKYNKKNKIYISD
jgi:hypothetical protein